MIYTAEQRAELFAKFLREYAKCGVKGLAADKAGLRRKTMRDWMEKYPKFKEKFDEINEVFVDGLESVAIERAKEKSDSLLMFLLKAKRSDEYQEKRDVNVTSEGPGAIKLFFSEDMLTDAEKEMIAAQKEKGEKNEPDSK